MAKTQRDEEFYRWGIEPPGRLHSDFPFLGSPRSYPVVPPDAISGGVKGFTELPGTGECVLWFGCGERIYIALFPTRVLGN
jgi:hypothetical protein